MSFATADDPDVQAIPDDRRRRAVIALFDIYQVHLSDYSQRDGPAGSTN